ncbi:Peptidoglycan/LPS O-acetylase OafA/YrhL, contains acyltransferase and SGNH-hydrolase domains [Methylobacterium sp. 190mf]|uniref:acyltransferase family protein n=1 Tax=Methylobacterium sp. 190mf TaxID=1761798 RepID=UPI00089F1F75|nr:acyltransferase family protein [Methylobacterium sp. 190mf]SEG71243.1 Peptidoglycan/LPS O-acetylase OafA/YrhL, contains acyltransferase and SGNH-hydrolase domains [Methylobacterium sp. 190mf]
MTQAGLNGRHEIVSNNFHYRSDIDGLRAVAVLSVVAFHYGLAQAVFSGGYVGVDVFFVISGYLITKTIRTEIEADRFSFTTFYLRRFRRLTPALIATYIGCILFSFLLMYPHEADLVRKSIISSILFSSNIFFNRQAGYFNQALQDNPLLHTWSLSVEEQFYLLFPAFLLLLYRFHFQMRATVILLLMALSLSFSIAIVHTDQNSAFYLLPSRAWELCVGSVVALEILPALRNRKIAELVGLGGFCLICCSFVLLTKNSTFPGAAAVPSCLGAAAVIHSGGVCKTYLGQILSIKLARFIGLISYSLYLVHWPVFVFFSIYRIPSRWDRCALVVLSIGLASFMWRYIECYFRYGPFKYSARSSLVGYGFSLAIVVSVAIILPGAVSDYWKIPRNAEKLLTFSHYDASAMMKEGSCFLTSSGSDLASYDRRMCLNVLDNKKNILIIGDSLAAHLKYGLDQVFPSYNFMLAAAGSCVPSLRELGDEKCNSLMNFIFKEYIPRMKLDGVLLSARWNSSDIKNLRELAEYLSRYIKLIIVIGPTVEYDGPLPRLLANSISRIGGIDVDAHRVVQKEQVDLELKSGLSDLPVKYVSVHDIICNRICTTVLANDIPLQFDYGHFTKEGSVYFATQLPKNLFGGAAVNQEGN